MIRIHATNLKIFCRGLLALLVIVGGMLASNDASAEDNSTRREVKTPSFFPTSVERHENAGIVMSPPVIRDPAEQTLLDDLTAARLAGDTVQSQTLQARLDALYGIVPNTFSQVPADEQTQVRRLDSSSRYSDQKWAGDVPIVSSSDHEVRPSLASAPDGTLYAAIENATDEEIWLYQSTDGGRSWNRGWVGGSSTLLAFSDAHNPSVTYLEASGGAKWLYVAYEKALPDNSREVRVYRWSVVDGTGGSIIIASGLYLPEDLHIAPEIGTDYPIFISTPYVYVTYAVNAIDYYAVKFSRSTDLGVTWRAPADVTGGADSSSWQTKPDISYGGGGLFIAFEKKGAGANQIWVTKSTNFGTDWGAPVQLTTSTYAEYHPRVAAAIGNNSVLIAYTREWSAADLDIMYAFTTDAGSTWSTNHYLAGTVDVVEKAVELDRSYSGGNFHAAFWQYYDIMYRAAATTAPSTWSTATLLNETNWASGDYPKPAVCVNPTRPVAEEAGIAWTDYRGASYDVYFDAGYLTPDSYLLWTK